LLGEAELRGVGRDCLEPVRRPVNPAIPTAQPRHQVLNGATNTTQRLPVAPGPRIFRK